jgi:serine/threonine-protein kinase HipA
MALSLASTKKVTEFDEARLKRLAAKAQLPERLVVETGLETAEALVAAWKEFAQEHEMRASLMAAVSERLKLFPLTRPFV